MDAKDSGPIGKEEEGRGVKGNVGGVYEERLMRPVIMNLDLIKSNNEPTICNERGKKAELNAKLKTECQI